MLRLPFVRHVPKVAKFKKKINKINKNTRVGLSFLDMYLQYSISYDFYGLMVFDSGIKIMAQNVYIFKIIKMCLAKSILKSSMNCLCCHHADRGKCIFYGTCRRSSCNESYYHYQHSLSKAINSDYFLNVVYHFLLSVQT